MLYFPAILLPILEIEKLGHHHAASLLGGTIDLVLYGNWFVGLVVLVFSIVLPLLKLIALLELSRIGLTHRRHRAWGSGHQLCDGESGTASTLEG